jgi:Sulfotransferase family
VKAIKKWPLYVQTVQAAGTRLPAGRYVEVRYEDLVTDTEATLRKLLDFLGEPWDDALLRYDEQPHDVQPRYLAFSSSRRAAANDPAAVYRSRVGAYQRELNPLLRLLFRLVAGRTLRELGYR